MATKTQKRRAKQMMTADAVLIEIVNIIRNANGNSTRQRGSDEATTMIDVDAYDAIVTVHREQEYPVD